MGIAIVGGIVVLLLSGVALMRGLRARIVIPVALVAIVLGSALAWASLAEPVQWHEATIFNHQTVRVTYTGSECEGHHSASVDESNSRVKISVTTRKWSTSCSDVGIRRSITVRLKADLGTRKLTDGNCLGTGDECERTPKGQ